MSTSVKQAAPAPMQPLLLVEDDEGLRTQLRWALSERYDVRAAADRREAVELFSAPSAQFPVVILDLGLPPDPNGVSEGMETLKQILTLRPETKIIIASGNEDRRAAVSAVGQGAYDFFMKPVDPEAIGFAIERAFNVYGLEQENRELQRAQARGLQGIVTGDPGMLGICRAIEKVASTDVSVLIFGESGTGKELLARAIHDLSARAQGPFIAINCAAIPETLLESELFGHERGAFTGAVRQTPGKVELADGGTLFLDEIGDMPMSLQAKLLRFLQDRRFERIGGRQTLSVDMRLITATNRDLRQRIAEGLFREDLMYRIDEVRVDVPPLRTRTSDPLLLANYFLGQFNQAYGRSVRGYSVDAIRGMSEYSWPGNIRELQNRVKRAIVMADDKLITAADLGLNETGGDGGLDLRQARERLERDFVHRALAQAQGNVSNAAKLLGVTRPTLYQLLKSLNIRH